jgi:hypothetical protein
VIRRYLGKLPLVALLICTSGCTAVLSTVQLFAADKAVSEAREKGADVHAPYEFLLAERHLDKAIEESASSQYKMSIDLAKQAKEYAETAVQISEGGSRGIQDLDKASDLTDEQAPDNGSDLRDVPSKPEDDQTPREDEFDDFDDDDDDDDWEDEE